MTFDLADIDLLSSATKAFVTGDESLKGLFGGSHPYYSDIAAIEGKKGFRPENRKILAGVLRSQYGEILESSPELKKNIDLLEQPDTFTITTGQQVHLFLGPALVFYKIIATIKAAEYYRSLHPNYHFLPVYWLASEDHDFEEIRSTKVFQHTFDWDTRQGGATGRFHVREVRHIIDSVRNELSLSVQNLALLEHIEAIYDSSASLSEASRKLVHFLFGKYGLICLNADNKQLKTIFLPEMKQELTERLNITRFNEFSSRMEGLGLSLQLKARDINLFYLSEGKRSRITFENGWYNVHETEISFTLEQLLSDLGQHPENYSPNAVLRPVYQEAVLPNICYIGGNAEVNYWLQLKEVFDYNRISPPRLVLRPSVWIVPTKVRNWLEKKGITRTELFAVKDDRQLLAMLEHNAPELQEKIAEFSALKKDIQDMAATEGSKHLKELVELGKAYEKLLKTTETDIHRNRKEKLDGDFKKLESIRTDFYDLHHVQERNMSTLELLIKYDNVLTLIYNSLEFKPSQGQIINF